MMTEEDFDEDLFQDDISTLDPPIKPQQNTSFLRNISSIKKRSQLAWYMFVITLCNLILILQNRYDWANSGYTTTLATFFARFYQSYACSTFETGKATVYYSFTISIALAIVAFLNPILGAIADSYNRRKLFLLICIILGCIFTSLISFTFQDGWWYCSLVFIFAEICYGVGDAFYNSLLVFIADSEEEMDSVSSKGYMTGYIGGGLLLVFNLIVILSLGNISEFWRIFAFRINFFSVAFWWFVFSIPLFLWVPEPNGTATTNGNTIWRGKILDGAKQLVGTVKNSFIRIGKTFRQISGFRSLFLFLIAFWFYNDGISTIIVMSVAFAAEVKDPNGNQAISDLNLFLALVAVQFLAVPFTLLFIPIAKKIGSKLAICVGISFYMIISIWYTYIFSVTLLRCFFLGKYSLFGMSNATTAVVQFWIMAVMVSMVQGSTQALSRSLFGSFCPKSKSSEFYGFFGFSGKVAGIVGPFAFGLVGSITGNTRLGMITIAVFFVIGLTLLSLVDVKKGIKFAKDYDKQQNDEFFVQLEGIIEDTNEEMKEINIEGENDIEENENITEI